MLSHHASPVIGALISVSKYLWTTNTSIRKAGGEIWIPSEQIQDAFFTGCRLWLGRQPQLSLPPKLQLSYLWRGTHVAFGWDTPVFPPSLAGIKHFRWAHSSPDAKASYLKSSSRCHSFNVKGCDKSLHGLTHVGPGFWHHSFMMTHFLGPWTKILQGLVLNCEFASKPLCVGIAQQEHPNRISLATRQDLFPSLSPSI